MINCVRAFFDAVFISRPVLWIPVWAYTILGYYCAYPSASQNVSFWNATPVGVFGWFLTFSCSVGAVYVINQLADRDVDARNPGFSLLAHGRVSARIAWTAVCVLSVIAIGVPLLFGRMIIAGLSVCAIIIGVIYSIRPLQLSGKPFLDFLANATGYGIVAFGVGWHCAGGSLVSSRFWVAATPYFLMMCAGSISSTIPDVNGDAASGKNTTAVVTGVRVAHSLGFLCVGLALICAGYSRDWLAGVAALCAMPWYTGWYFKPAPFWIEASYKIGGAILMILTAIVYPLLAVPSVLALGATWLYFRVRFNVIYPSLMPAKPCS